jgi:hypothetical protein
VAQQQLGHLDSQRSLPTIRPDQTGVSATAKKLRLLPNHDIAVLNAPADFSAQLQPGPKSVATELRPAETCGFRPASCVAVDDTWTALRFKRV